MQQSGKRRAGFYRVVTRGIVESWRVLPTSIGEHMKKLELRQLRERQEQPLHEKEVLTEALIRFWYTYWEGQVYVSFSGGKDSTVLLHQVRKYYPDVPAVFVDTGLEYPEIKSFVRTFNNVTWIKPKIPFNRVIEKYGYPVTTKRSARFIRDIQNSSDKNKATVNLRLTGFTKDGKYTRSLMLPKKWRPLAYSDIKVSEQCCDVMKKEPFKRYGKLTGRMPFSGMMAYESKVRELQYLSQGCNKFDGKIPMSMPLAFWTEQDIYDYREKYDISFSSIYETEQSTGCMFCMFGVHLEKGENRFQRMKQSHPNQYDYCINKLGCGEVLDFIGVDY